jgi:O-antigen/teichoic acid export membrane protein
MYFVYVNQRTHKIRWRFNKNLASKTLKDSWPIYLGTIFAFIYLKIDILMLKAISGLSEVGYYSIAAQLSEGWYFIPAILTSTYMPKLHNSKSFNDTSYYFQISTLSSYFVLLSYSVVLFILLFSDSLVVFIYGEKFAATSLILQIHIFAGIFFTLRNIFSKWLILEELYYLSLWSQLLGALSNVILNLLLIPIYGGIGAAIATLVSYMFASYFILLFFRKTRKLFWIFTKSLFLIPLFKKI